LVLTGRGGLARLVIPLNTHSLCAGWRRRTIAPATAARFGGAYPCIVPVYLWAKTTHGSFLGATPVVGRHRGGGKGRLSARIVLDTRTKYVRPLEIPQVGFPSILSVCRDSGSKGNIHPVGTNSQTQDQAMCLVQSEIQRIHVAIQVQWILESSASV
jgi:hypothetical protein